MSNVFVIGNGFDLDLGLKTKYSDFTESEFWPSATKGNVFANDNGIVKVSYPKLPMLDIFIRDAKDKKNWFDLEKELLAYAKIERTGEFNYDTRNEGQGIVEQNVAYFNKLLDSLNKYITYVQTDSKINKDCRAKNVLSAIVENGYFENIYSFNYTDLTSLAKRLGITQEFQYNHLHGKVSNGTIILGVDETPLRNGYEIFHKSSSRYYRSHNLYNALTAAEEIVIFGLSFGSIDYSYFDRFFKQISEGESIADDKKKYITIFTGDDQSRLNIISNLRNMGINIQRLYAQSHFQIICNSDDVEEEELSDFYHRLKNPNYLAI